MADGTGGVSKLLLVIIAILLPPLAVALKSGLSSDFWINLILFFVPFPYVGALIHALYLILK